MGIIGRFLESLTDEDRDAIIRHPDPTFEGDYYARICEETPENPGGIDHGCACLVGTVVVQRMEEAGHEISPNVRPMEDLLTERGLLSIEETLEWYKVALHFPKLTKRFGPERIWRAIKRRCAALNGVPVGDGVVGSMTDREVMELITYRDGEETLCMRTLKGQITLVGPEPK